jgi:WD40 repeat protein
VPRLWDLATGRVLAEGTPSGAAIRRLAFSGDVVATGDGSGAVRLWDPSSGRSRQVARAEPDGPIAFALDGAGGRLAFALPGGLARVVALPPRDLAALRRAAAAATNVAVEGGRIVAHLPDGSAPLDRGD